MTARPRLVELEIAADAAAWRAAGFAIGDDARCRIGTTDLVFRDGAAGLIGWALGGTIPAGDGIDGLPTRAAHGDDGRPPAPAQPNGITGIDHVVVSTPDLARTLEAFDAAGLQLRRTRDAGTPERPLRQGFLLLAEALIEVVGPAEPDPHAAAQPAAFWGLTLVSADLDATVAALGTERIAAPRAAVQEGRRIAVVRREAGLGLPVAVMTPR